MIYLQFSGLILFLIMYIWFFSSHRRNKKKNQLKKIIRSGALILDVRDQSDFKEVHRESAINIPPEKLYQKKDKLPNDLNLPIVVCYRSANQARKAISILRSMGYKRIINSGGLSTLLKLESEEKMEE